MIQSDHCHGTKLISHPECEGHLKGIVNTKELILLELLAMSINKAASVK